VERWEESDAPSRSRRFRLRRMRVRLLAAPAFVAAAAVVLVSIGALDQSPVAPYPRPEESAVRPGLFGEPAAFHLPGQKVYTEVRNGGGRYSRSHQTPTYVIAVKPVDSNHQPVAGLKIEEGGAARICRSGSEVGGRAYRCFGHSRQFGSFVADPCWRDDADPSTPAVLCQGRAWEDHVIRFTMQQGRFERFLEPPRVVGNGSPWGIELMNGERCYVLQGAHSAFPIRGSLRVIDYYCQSKTGEPGDRVLLRGIDRSNPRWTITPASRTPGWKLIPALRKRNGYELHPRIGIAKAWYLGQEP